MTVKTLHGNKIAHDKIISAGYSVIKNFGVPIRATEQNKNFYVNDIYCWINTEDGMNYIIKQLDDEESAKLYLLDFVKKIYEVNKIA